MRRKCRSHPGSLLVLALVPVFGLLPPFPPPAVRLIQRSATLLSLSFLISIDTCRSSFNKLAILSHTQHI
jgi:hypothetical protein